MKENTSRKIYKIIICLMIIIIMFEFSITNISYAADADGSSAYDPFMKFITYLCDKLMQFMQRTFISTDPIINSTLDEYNFQYSPAIIFSGTVPAFDINFISPMEDVTVEKNIESFIAKRVKDQLSSLGGLIDGNNPLIDDEYWNNKAAFEAASEDKSYNQLINYSETPLDIIDGFKIYMIILYKISGENVTVCTRAYYTIYGIESNFYFKDVISLNSIEEFSYESTANVLQPTVAKYYNALRKITLVGLLSVLVYLGIRIVASSSSAEGNSRYKKMLINWLVALCLVFTLHYLMNLIFIVTQKLTEVFTLGETDELLNNIRQNINEAEDWGVAFTEVLMYVVIVIYTCIFTFQYYRRVLYMAFFTMIAPLITLTYPLDKIKDGKAQAFTMWLREYTFNALIPVVHLVVYYTLVGSAMALVEEYPLFALVAISFMTQGEKIIRKMFGFNNSETIGTMGAMAMGGLISNGLNKLKSLPKGGSSGGNSHNVRTATNNNSNASLQRNTRGMQGNSATKSKGKTIKGIEKVGGKFILSTAKGAAGVLIGGTGAMIGLAAGISQGNIGAALGGAIAGGKAGMNLPQNAVNKVKGVGKNAINTFNNVRDTFNEGAYGEEAANKIKSNREFKKGSTYKALKDNPNFSEASIDAMLDSGITDKGAMERILGSGLDVNEAIKYHTIAQNLSAEMIYNKKMMKTFCKDLREMDSSFSNQSYGKIRDNVKKFLL